MVNVRLKLVVFDFALCVPSFIRYFAVKASHGVPFTVLLFGRGVKIKRAHKFNLQIENIRFQLERGGVKETDIDR